MSIPSLRDLLSEIPAFERHFQRKYQVRTVLRMNDLLAERGLTQKDIVERTGWNKGFVSRLLSGSGNLTLRTLARFEDAVGADVLDVTTAAETKAVRKLAAFATVPMSGTVTSGPMDISHVLHHTGALISAAYTSAPAAYAGE